MVEKIGPNGDGVVRPLMYAKFRNDVPAEPGYSRELINVNLDPKYYDDLEGQPPHTPGCFTFLDYFETHVKNRRDDPFLGYRQGGLGDYQWKTYGDIE